MKLTFLLALFCLLSMLLISWYQQHIRRNVYHTENFCVPVHVDGNSANTHPSSHIKESYFSRISKVNAKWLVRLVKTSSIAFESFDYVISVSEKAVFRKGRKWKKHLQIQLFNVKNTGRYKECPHQAYPNTSSKIQKWRIWLSQKQSK